MAVTLRQRILTYLTLIARPQSASQIAKGIDHQVGSVAAMLYEMRNAASPSVRIVDMDGPRRGIRYEIRNA